MPVLWFAERKINGKKLQFSKMHGLGNDFVIIDAVTQNVRFSPDRIRQLADRRFGIGFDQLLLVEPPLDPAIDFHYRIFNADGNEVAQCGNGARCVGRFVLIKGLTNKSGILVSTDHGKLLLNVCQNDLVSVNMGEPIFDPQQIPFRARKAETLYLLRSEQQTIIFGAVSMGNPHCVIRVDDVSVAPVERVGLLLASHERFPESVNVGFMEVLEQDHIRLRVYERGVGETLACGSGACAAVSVGIQQGLLAENVRVDLPGGTLQITWKGVGNPLWMIGSATYVYDGFIYERA